MERHRSLAEYRAELDRLEEALRASVAQDELQDARIEAAKRAARVRRGSATKEVSRSARHEAGHCVVALALGRTVVGSLIDGDGRGCTWYLSGHGDGPPAHAGVVAERLAGNGGARLSRSDRFGAAAGGDALLDQFLAEEVVALNEGKVAELAEALIERGYASDVTIDAIVGRPRVPSAVVESRPE